MISIAEQKSPGAYNIHVFEDTLHFQAWMSVYRPANMRPASQARGRKACEINHVNECDWNVIDKRIELASDAQSPANKPK
jgi:hypothetical protein